MICSKLLALQRKTEREREREGEYKVGPGPSYLTEVNFSPGRSSKGPVI